MFINIMNCASQWRAGTICPNRPVVFCQASRNSPKRNNRYNAAWAVWQMHNVPRSGTTAGNRRCNDHATTISLIFNERYCTMHTFLPSKHMLHKCFPHLSCMNLRRLPMLLKWGTSRTSSRMGWVMLLTALFENNPKQSDSTLYKRSSSKLLKTLITLLGLLSLNALACVWCNTSRKDKYLRETACW